MDAAPNVETELRDCPGDRGRGTQRLRRLRERCEEAVPCRVLLTAAVPLQLPADDSAKAGQQLAPARVAELGRQRGRADDVDEEHRREAAHRRGGHESIIARRRPAAYGR